MASFVGRPGSLNQMSMQSSLGKPLSLSSAAWYLALYQDSAAWDIPTKEAFASAIAQHSEAFFGGLGQPQPFTSKKDPRHDQILASRQPADAVRIFTDYEVLTEALTTIPMPKGLIYVEKEEEADFVFTCRHVRNFLQLPLHQRVCQFPYEAAIIRKDLLPITARKHLYKPDGSGPSWWQPCYDLATEFHLFAHDYQERLQHNSRTNAAQDRRHNRWIIKPAQGTRGMGHQLIFSETADDLRKAACYAPRILMSHLPVPLNPAHSGDYGDNTGDRVVQLLVEQPLLIDHRKFDIRCYVFVRSFDPFVAYVPQLHYARLANKPYSMKELDNREVALTVSAYDEDEAIANAQERHIHTEFQSCLDAQYGDNVVDSSAMWTRTLEMLRELFGSAAAKEIGSWPNSSAYYGVDVIYDASGLTAAIEQGSTVTGFVPQPKLVEVNFLGDWHVVDMAVNGDKELYHHWVRDLLQVLVMTEQVTTDELDNHPRLHRL